MPPIERTDTWITDTCSKSLVSVIIPTYNREVFLQEAIESVIKQTYRPIECIIVDDGSLDNTSQVVKKYLALEEEGLTIKYIYQENAGSQAARNNGTMASSGEFIQYLDSDDLLYADKIEKQVGFLHEFKIYDGVFGDWQIGTPDKKDTIVLYKNDDFISQMFAGGCIHTLSFLMRRSIIAKAGAWDLDIKRNQEIDFHLSSILAGGNFEYQSLVCGLWRTHTDGRIGNTTALKDVVFFFKKWEKILSTHKKLTPEMKKNIANIYFWFSIQNIAKTDPDRVLMLKEAARLYPSIPFFNSKKMYWLSKFFGKEISINLWLAWYRLHKKQFN